MRGKQTVTPTLRLRTDGAVLVEFCISVCGAYKVHSAHPYPYPYPYPFPYPFPYPYAYAYP